MSPYNGDKKHFFNKFHPLKIIFFVGLAALLAFLLGGVIMFLWNAILPRVTGFKPITYWEAIGLFILAKIFFGGFGNKRWGGPRHRSRKKHWREKWMNMNPEEKAQMKEKWKDYCKKK